MHKPQEGLQIDEPFLLGMGVAGVEIGRDDEPKTLFPPILALTPMFPKTRKSPASWTCRALFGGA